MRKTSGVILENIVAATMITGFLIISTSYLGIWAKLRQVSLSSATTSEHQKKYQKSVKIMMFLITAFIGQWWAYILYSTCSFFIDPPLVITVSAVTFSNMGGFFNFLAYTFIRKRQASVNTEMSGKDRTTTT